MNNEDIIIKKIYKRGKYFYITFSDNNCTKFDSEIYFKYNLKEGNIFDSKKYSSLLNENSFKLCLNTVLNLLAMRMHSTYELKSKLKHKGFNFSIVNKVINEAKSMNLLNDDLFAKNYIEELIERGQGKYKIISTLRKKGIPLNIIDDCLDGMVDSEYEKARALELMNRKLKSLSNKNIESRKLKEKLARHLISKGFASDIVFNLVNEKIQ